MEGTVKEAVDIAALMNELVDKDDRRAYAKARDICAASELSPVYYAYLEDFAALLDCRKSYHRARGAIICCSLARWDDQGKLAALLPRLCALLADPKPSVVRQCLRAFMELVTFRPELADAIKERVLAIDLSPYKETMVSLISNDMDELLNYIDELQAQ